MKEIWSPCEFFCFSSLTYVKFSSKFKYWLNFLNGLHPKLIIGLASNFLYREFLLKRQGQNPMTAYSHWWKPWLMVAKVVEMVEDVRSFWLQKRRGRHLWLQSRINCVKKWQYMRYIFDSFWFSLYFCMEFCGILGAGGSKLVGSWWLQNTEQKRNGYRLMKLLYLEHLSWECIQA